jgi:hypothetical protein
MTSTAIAMAGLPACHHLLTHNILMSKRIAPPPSNTREIRQHIDLHIVTMPNIIMPSHTTELQQQILHDVHQLKVERDTWQALALEYKEAFKGQTKRLHELQDVCIATQAELENERAERHRLQTLSMSTHDYHPSAIDGAEDVPSAFGTAVVFSRSMIRNKGGSSDEHLNPIFQRVQLCVDRSNYGMALAELERLLQGPLSPKARAEGLLMKSRILKAAGPDELLDALAACSEAQELCNRLSDLESFLPKIQYQQGILYYQLRMLQQARDAFSAVSDDTTLSATANEYRSSCEDEIRIQRAANRRSGFDENRGFEQGLLMKLDEKLDVSGIYTITISQNTH